MQTAETAPVYIVEDDAGMRNALRFLVRNSGRTVRGWPDGQSFLDDVAGLPPGVLLLDLRMPGIDGIEVLEAVGRLPLTMPTVMLSGHGDIPIAVSAMTRGAVDFLEKPFQRERLIAAIETCEARLAAAGRVNAGQRRAQAALAVLTQREREVLARLANGSTNREVAEQLGISPRTVEVHRANLVQKLGVRSFSETLRIAFEAGLAADQLACTDKVPCGIDRRD